MPQLLPGDTALTTDRQYISKAKARQYRKDLTSKVDAFETEGLGAVPTSLVYAGALSATDDKESARWAALIARQLDLPKPPIPTGKGGRTGQRKHEPKQVVDPYTGKAISLPRAQALTMLGANLADALDQPIYRGARPDPGAVYQYVAAQSLLTEVPAEFAVAAALDMERKGTPIERFRANLAIVDGWNKDTGTISDEEAVVYARWWAEHKDRPITPGDLVTLTTPELTQAIRDKKQAINTNPYAQLTTTEAGHELFYGEYDQLVTARNKAMTNPNYLDDARRILESIDYPSWTERALSWSAAQLTKEWHVTQHIFVDVSTPFVAAVDLAQAAMPGGQDYADAIRETQRERQYLIQRINAGDSVGQIYAEDSFLPSWAAPAFDFAVGWTFDPFIVGGKILTGARATRALPGVLEAERLTGRIGQAIAPERLSNWWHELQWNNFGGSVMKFARSRTSRRLYNAVYEGTNDAALYRTIDRLATHFEARSALEYQYMSIARAEMLAKYPQQSERAWQEWQRIMMSHFPVDPPPGSLAERVVAIRKGQGEEAVVRSMRATQTGEGLIISPTRTTEIIRESTGPLRIRTEVPHRLLPVPLAGGVKLGRLRFRESRLGQTDIGSSLSSIFNVNPGAVLRPGRDPEIFFARKAARWRTFTEPEIREFQARATSILNSGVGVERNMAHLLEEMDRTAIRRIANRMGMDPEAASEVVDQITFRLRRINQQATFGVTEETQLGRTVATRPLTESQLIDEIVSMDPVQIRNFLNRYNSTFADLSRSMKGHGLPDVAAAAFRTEEITRDFLRGAARTWKFMVVPRPAYIGRVVLGDENLRFLATTGALFDRFASLELNKGLRGLIGRGLSKIGAEDIRLGDITVNIGRSGTIGYEPLANQAFHTEEALDDILRNAGLRDRSLKALGHHGAIQPGDVQHLVMWERTLNYQLGNSQAGRVALESIRNGETVEGTAQRLRAWAKADNYTILRTRIGVMPEQTYEWANKLAGMAHGYTMGNPDIAYAAITRSVGKDILSAVPREARPTIHGPLVESLTAAAGSSNPLKRFINFWYDAMVRTPENILNRQPYYRVWKRAATKAEYRALEQQGYGTAAKPITSEMEASIDAASRDFALEQVRKIMFDFTENTRFGEMASAFIPFFQPWAEAYQVWGHILLHRNPAMIGYVRQTWALAEKTGVVQRDENGQWVTPWSFWARATALLPWVGGDKLPEGLGLVAPLSSFNLFLSSSVEVGGFPVPVPGLAPWAAIPLKDFFSETQNPYLISYLFGYGPETPIVSRWLERAFRVIKPDAFNDSRDDAVAMDMLRLYQYLGTDRDENGDLLPADELKARARADATRLNAMFATIGAFAPTAGRVTFPEGYQEREAELDQMRDTLGFEEGTDAFLAKYPELTLMTIGKTVDTRQLDGETAPRLPQSEDVQALFRLPAFERFAKRFPSWTAALVLSQDEQWDESSLGVFSDQLHSGAIKYKGLDRFYAEGQAAGFWNAVDAMYAHINPIADDLEAQGLEDTNARVQDLATQKGEMLYDIYLRYPQYATKQGIRPDPQVEGQAIWDGDEGTPPSELVLRQAQQIVELKGFESFPAIQGLKAYLDLRERTQAQMERAGIDDIGSSTAQRLGAVQVAVPGTRKVVLGKPPVKVYVQGNHPAVQAAADRAIALWNDAVGGKVLQLVPDGTKDAVPIRLANERNDWYQGMAQDEEAEFTEGQVRGTRRAFLNETDLTLAHELGHALGLYHPYPTSTAQRYIPATERRVERGMEGPRPAQAWKVGAVGLMGNEMHKNDPDFRGGGPSPGEIEYLRGLFKEKEVVNPGDVVWQGGLTDQWEQGKAAILEQFPEVEPFLNAFFDDDLEGVPSKAERQLLRMRDKDPARYDRYLVTDDTLESYSDKALAATSSDERSAVYNGLADYVDTLYEHKQTWRLRLWFDRKSASSRETYMESLQAKPPVFYTQFDWELMGVKLTPYAAKVWASYRAAREEITRRSEAELRGGPTFLSGNAYESIDKQMANFAKHDASLRKSLEATRSFGWGLFHSLPEGSAGVSLVDQKGKAGYAWRYVADLTSQVNDAIIKLEWHGPDTFDSDADKRNYVLTRDSLYDAIQEFMKWSPVFKQQWMDFQRTQLRGDPLIEWIMPDTYFPIGITGD